jgi:hypothetical protein
MASPGRPRTATILKLLSGSAQHNPQRLRDDAAIKPPGQPSNVAWFALNKEERRIFQWLRANALLRTVHSRADSLLLAKLATTINVSLMLEARMEDTNASSYGSDFRRWRQCIDLGMRLMSELCLTPSMRLKLAPPLPRTRGSGWDDIV